MEGLEIATDTARPLVVPLTLVIIFGLFMAQKHGTDGIARIFGPVMLVWFLVIGGLGLLQIFRSPDVLMALNPSHALDFFSRNRFHGIVVLGSVVLCITGGEALYADMGHFGKRAIRPLLAVLRLSGALAELFRAGGRTHRQPGHRDQPLLRHRAHGLDLSHGDPLHHGHHHRLPSHDLGHLLHYPPSRATRLLPPGARHPHLALHGGADIHPRGQRLPHVGAASPWSLIFKESSRLAAAYGIAVTATMTITSCLFFLVARKRWNWPLWKALPLLLLFCLFDVSFFGSNLLKIFDGGWIPVVIAITVVTCMSTWKAGRAALGKVLLAETVPLELFLDDVAAKKPHRAKGTAVFLSVSPTGAPVTLLHFFKHSKMLHEKVVILSIQSSDEPYASIGQNLTVSCLGEGFYRVVATYGFMQTPDVPQIMEHAATAGC